MNITEELAKKAYELGFDYEKRFGGCAQCVLCALGDSALSIDDAVIKAATGLAAGTARAGNSCGAFTGGIMAISTVTGRERSNMENNDANLKTMELSRKLLARFEEEYGSSLCRDIQTKIMGRSYRMYDPVDRQQFLDDGGHDDKCTNVVGLAARWTVEVLAEAGLL